MTPSDRGLLFLIFAHVIPTDNMVQKILAIAILIISLIYLAKGIFEAWGK